MSFVNLPEFPSIEHLVPWSKRQSDDSLAPTKILRSMIGKRVEVQEKMDGANVGLTVADGRVFIRNRNRMLNESHTTRASFQYGPLWNWCYSRLDELSKVCQDGRFAVYGEWCYVQNGTRYDELPAHFVAFDLWDFAQEQWVPHPLTEQNLGSIPQTALVYSGIAGRDFESNLRLWADKRSLFSSFDRREGLMVRSLEGTIQNVRYKVVRPDYQGGRFWSFTQPIINLIDAQSHGLTNP